jgi:lactobin A/cerein 7B family class IIb bacteriocin
MTTQMTIDKTAELSNQELSLEQLEDVQGGVIPQLLVGGAIVYGAYKFGKWLVKKVGEATTNLDSDGDSGCGDGSDCGDGANKLSFYEMRKSTTLIV